MDWIQSDFMPTVDAEQGARRCIRRIHLGFVKERITALLDLGKAISVKFIKNYLAGVGLAGDFSVKLKGLHNLSNRCPRLVIVSQLPPGQRAQS